MLVCHVPAALIRGRASCTGTSPAIFVTHAACPARSYHGTMAQPALQPSSLCSSTGTAFAPPAPPATHVRVVLHELPWLEVDHLGAILWPAQVLDALQVQLLQDACLTDDVHLLVAGEVDGLQVGGGGVGGAVDLLLWWWWW